MSGAYLELRNVKKSFALKSVLRGVNLTLDTGERMALLGANGAGKTTLLRLVAGLLKPGGGEISIGGLDLVSHAQEIRSKVGFVAHQPYLYENLTAEENLHFFGRMYGYGLKKSRLQAGILLQRVGLSKKARERTSALSRGQLQRLALARALLHEPEILLLDEAETGLDQDGRTLLAELLAEHQARGGTILFTTHDLETALAQSDTLVMLNNGRVAYQKETSSIESASLLQVYQEVVR